MASVLAVRSVLVTREKSGNSHGGCLASTQSHFARIVTSVLAILVRAWKILLMALLGYFVLLLICVALFVFLLNIG